MKAFYFHISCFNFTYKGRKKTMLLKDYLINKRILFKEDKEGFIHVLDYTPLHYFETIDYTLLRSNINSSINCYQDTKIYLPNFKYIGRDLDCRNATEINLPNLEYVGWGLYCRNVAEVNFPNLKYVGYSLDCTGVSKVNLPNLKYVGGTFFCKDFKTIFPKLKYVIQVGLS